MADESGRRMGSAAIFGVAVLLNLLLTVLLLDQVTRTRGELDGLRDELASKQDVGAREHGALGQRGGGGQQGQTHSECADHGVTSWPTSKSDQVRGWSLS